MKFHPQHTMTAAQRGGATLVLVNLVVLLLIVALGAGYYFFQVRPALAAAEFEKALENEKKGHLTSAELAYREAVRLDPSNAHYHASLDALVRGEGNLKEAEKPVVKPGPRTASAGLFPQSERASSTPSLSGTTPLVNTSAPPPSPEPRIVRKNVEVAIAAPEGAEYEIIARNTPLYVPGETLVPWTPVTGVFQRELPIGEYELVVRMTDVEPAEERFTVKEEGGVLQTVEFRFGMLRIDSVPAGAEVFDAVSEDPIGTTPFAMLRSPGDVGFTLKAEGHKDSTLEGAVMTRGVLHFNHQLAALTPVAPKPKVETKPAPAAVAARKPEPKKPEVKPEPEPVVMAAAIIEQPVFGRPFVSETGMEFVYGEKSNRGDPFWITKAMPLKGWETGAARDYCANLTETEQAKGRVPEGYGYFPAIAGDGRIALCRKYYDTGTPVPTQPTQPMRADSELAQVTRITGNGAPVQGARPTVKAVVVAETAPGDVAFGRSFVNSGQMVMEYRERDAYGNPFWRSAEPVLRGVSLVRANQLCAQLTERERVAGRVPNGYAYAVAGEGDGRVVLWRNVLPGRVGSLR